ncbi:hypothetical protein [Streptomyces sp. NPDC050121]|uniref:hypothetical protein n=1 Tax=Streptomyces sp. NPDC050121 TaxID=3365601 RepID=UPI0037AC4413
MGDTYQTIVDRYAGPQDAPSLARPVVEWLVAEGIVLAEAAPGWALGDHPAHPPGPNWHKAVTHARWGAPEGVAVHTERHVFYSNFNTSKGATAICPRCGTAADPDDPVWSSHMSTVMDLWYETGTADADCASCAESAPLPEWDWTDDHLAFVHLGFQFWNWPTLSEDFRARMGELLGGRRTAFLPGKV